MREGIAGVDLPACWCWARVDEVGEVRLGRQRSPQHHTGDHMRPYLRVANVYEDRIDTSDVHRMNFTPKEFEIYELKPGDVLLNEGQSLELVGRAAVFRGDVPGACFQNTLIRFRAGPAVLPAFALLVFRHYLHSGVFQKVARWTTSIAHLGAARLADLPFPVPPLAEQSRIANALDERLTELAAAVSGLERTRANLKRYRASVLQVACEGRLLPEGPAPRQKPWTWTTLSEVTTRITDGTHQPPRFTPHGVPFLFVHHIVSGKLSFEGTRFISHDTYDTLTKRCRVQRGDVLYSAVGSYGTAVVVDTDEPFTFQRHIAHLKPSSDVVPGWLALWLNSPQGLSQAHAAARGVAQKTVALGELRAFSIAVPSQAEQMRIVDAVLARLEAIEHLYGVVETQLARAGALRQSILKLAFEGRLVPQDRNDRPESDLLENAGAGV